jgi:hypothetical protein
MPKLRVTIQISDSDAAKLERYDRAIYELGARLLPLAMAGRPFTHDPRVVIQALVLDAIVNLDARIAETEAKGPR